MKVRKIRWDDSGYSDHVYGYIGKRNEDKNEIADIHFVRDSDSFNAYILHEHKNFALKSDAKEWCQEVFEKHVEDCLEDLFIHDRP
jgi:hypothetical protein